VIKGLGRSSSAHCGFYQ